MLNDEFDFGFNSDCGAIEVKKEKVNKYAAYSESLGQLV